MPKVILSVVGPHAGEGVESIFARKIRDLQQAGVSLWYLGSTTVRTALSAVEGGKVEVLFLESSGKGSAARPTTVAQQASQMLVGGMWQPIYPGISGVTGKLTGRGCGLVLSSLVECSEEVDLWDYSMLDGSGVQFALGRSTVPVLLQDSSNEPDKMKSHKRRVVARATLAAPYAVVLR